MTVAQLRKVAGALGKRPWELVKEVDDLADRVERGPIKLKVLDEQPASTSSTGW